MALSMEVPAGPFLSEFFPSQSQLPATNSHAGKETSRDPKCDECCLVLAVLLPADA